MAAVAGAGLDLVGTGIHAPKNAVDKVIKEMRLPRETSVGQERRTRAVS